MAFTESIVEDATLDWFGDLDYALVHGQVIAPGEAAAERTSFGEAFLPERLRAALRRLNPKLPTEALDEAFRKITIPQHPTLIASNRAFHRLLVEAWEKAEGANPGKFLTTPEGDFSAGEPTERLIPADPAERLAIARRYVTDRCLYGVDINPMAVEMAKLSLWLITLQRDRPFNFLDHALKCGDSLLGVSSVQQIENFSLRPGHRQVTFATANLFRYVEEASAKRRALEDLPSNDHTQIETKTRLHTEAEAATAKVKSLADVLIAFELRGLDGDTYEDQRANRAEKVQLLMKRDADVSISPEEAGVSQLNAYARQQLHGRRPFHWSVEFPEVIACGGFDAFVGNPPFLGGSRITGVFGTDYRDYLLMHLAKQQRGRADLSAYFFLRIFGLIRLPAVCGLIATNTIAQGDTREVGLDQIMAAGAMIPRAIPSRRWPGDAVLEVAHIWLRRGEWRGSFLLNDQPVNGITSFLVPPSDVKGKPFRLKASCGQSFQGCVVIGTGFILQPDQAYNLFQISSANREVIFPYINGEDLNTRPDQTASRWIIDFHDWPLEKAANYSDCLSIIREKVKPERDKIRREAYRKRWWLFAEHQPSMYAATKSNLRVLLCSLISKHLSFAFVPNGWVYANKCCVFARENMGLFTMLQSSEHYLWAREFSSTMKSDLNYSPTDCFETFPFPGSLEILEVVGSQYYEHRQSIMLAYKEGLTKTYNRFHDQGEPSADIARLRALHVEMDQAVAAAYGWSDLDMGHGFHETKQGVRFTLSEPARRTVLDRLLALNHQRYAEEVKAGLHEKKKAKAKSPKSKVAGISVQGELIKPPQTELFG